MLRANDEDKGGDEGVGRWGDRGMADYAKDLHNIRRLKFSHNIRARQHDSGKKQKKQEARPRRRTRRRRRSQSRGMRRPERLGIGLCFLFVLACVSMCILRTCMRGYVCVRTLPYSRFT